MKRRLPRLGLNPIIVKEIRSRMRGPRAFITLTIMLLVMGGILAAILQVILATSRYNTVLSPQIGQTMFAALSFLILFMVCAITPAVTSGAISGEKEKLTFEMLMATPLSPARILLGKLISAMSYVLLLLFASIPLASLVFLFGGVAPSEMLKVLIVLLVVALMLGVLGLFMSALFGRTGRATVASFITVVVLLIGPMFIALMVGILKNAEPPRLILAPSPISALSGALAPSLGTNNGFEIFYVLSGLWNMGVNPVSQTEIPRPIYHYSLPLFLGLTLIMFLLTTRMVQPSRRWRLSRKEVLGGLLALFIFALIIGAGFLMSANRYEWALRGQVLEPTPTPFLGMAIEPFPVGPGIVIEQKVVQAYPVENGLTATPTPATEGAYLPPQLTPARLDVDNETGIYAAVIRQMYEVDHTFDQAPNFPVLYLVQQTNDRIGDPNVPVLETVELDQNLRDNITLALADLPTEVHWVATFEDVPTDDKTGAVTGEGAAIRLGNIHIQDDGSVQVSASLYFASLGATGKTYILAYQNGAWTVTGTTGVEWIS